jgi:hypothetical protein
MENQTLSMSIGCSLNPSKRIQITSLLLTTSTVISRITRIDNQEWATYSENSIHAYKTGLYKSNERKRRLIIDTCTGEMFISMKKAAVHLYIITQHTEITYQARTLSYMLTICGLKAQNSITLIA